jgi:predicted acyltransferase
MGEITVMSELEHAATEPQNPPEPRAEAQTPTSSKPRIQSVDILRGLAILGMALSGMLPWGTLPAWMYHAQLPPPEMKFNPEIPGITWVDLVFPFFLFALGAAIPLSLGRKVEQLPPLSENGWIERFKLIGGLLWRGALLLLFAYISQHFRPFSLNGSPTETTWWLSLLFFGATILVWGRFPSSWPAASRYALPVAGLIAFATAPNWLPPAGDKPFAFDPGRVDIILFVLANVAVSGSLIWWATKDRPYARLAIIGAVTAIFLTNTVDGPGKMIWDWTPLKEVYQFGFHKYLLIVLPGTFCGELVRLHAKHREPDGHTPAAGWFVAIVGLSASVIACIGLLNRDVTLTLVALMVLCGGAYAVISRACHMSDAMRQMAAWGTVLILIGILLDPQAGGIKKDSANLSYFFTTSGLAFWMVIAWSEITKNALGARIWQPLAQVGQNPILGYVAITNFVPAFIRLTGIHPWVGGQGWDPWMMAGYGLFQTLLVAIICAIAARFKFYLRA